MPNEETEPVAVLVEDVGLVDPSCPRAGHVLIAGDEQVKPGLVPVVRDARRASRGRPSAMQSYPQSRRARWRDDLLCQERVCRDPVAPAAEDADVVDLKQEGRALSAIEGLLDHSRTTEPRLDDSGGDRHRNLWADEIDLDRVDWLAAVVDWIPEIELARLERPVNLAVLRLGRLDDSAGGVFQSDDGGPDRLARDAGDGPCQPERELGAGWNVEGGVDSLDGDGEVRGKVFGDVRVDADVRDPRSIVLDEHWLPRPGRHEDRSPVPAVVVLRLAHVQSRRVAVPCDQRGDTSRSAERVGSRR